MRFGLPFGLIRILPYALYCMAMTTMADDPSSIQVTHAWSRAMPPSSTTGAIYLHIINSGSEPDRLRSAYTPQAERTELHQHLMVNGLMHMQPIPDGLEIPAQGQVDFRPGQNHLMLINLTQPLVAGQYIPLTLRFDRQGEYRLTVPVLDHSPESPDTPHTH